MKPHDLDLMQHADGERERAPEPTREGRAKVAAIRELGELVRGHLELSADAVPARKFEAMWREIDDAIAPATTPSPGFGARRLALVRALSRSRADRRGARRRGRGARDRAAAVERERRRRAAAPIQVTPAAYRPTEIEELETPGGTGTVFNLKDDRRVHDRDLGDA